jgi:hypothetical protein
MKLRLGLAATILTAAVACAHGGLDRSRRLGSPAEVELSEVPVKGFDVTVRGNGGSTIEGELLGIDHEYLYVLAKDGTTAIARADVVSVSLQMYSPSGAGTAAVWTLLGALSTVSHGYYAVFTAPTWAVVGGGTAIVMATAGSESAARDELGQLFQFARFPQGLPPDWPENRHPAPWNEDLARAVAAAEQRVLRGLAEAGVDASPSGGQTPEDREGGEPEASAAEAGSEE